MLDQEQTHVSAIDNVCLPRVAVIPHTQRDERGLLRDGLNQQYCAGGLGTETRGGGSQEVPGDPLIQGVLKKALWM